MKRRVINREVVVNDVHYIVHFVMQRRLVACAGGLCLMYAGTAFVECPPMFVSHTIWECVCYTVHAVGCIPILKPLEARVGRFIGSTEEIHHD